MHSAALAVVFDFVLDGFESMEGRLVSGGGAGVDVGGEGGRCADAKVAAEMPSHGGVPSSGQ